jgi:DNA-binding beta-propeller fold protein YncE
VQIADISGAGWTAYDGGAAPLALPSAVASDGICLYVADTANNRIVRLASGGSASFGALGSGTGQFRSPKGISVDATDKNRIYVADSGNNRIVRIDSMAGDGWIALGTRGSGPMQFNDPSGIFFSRIEGILVADTGNNRIVRMDNISGDRFTAYGRMGSGVGEFNAPQGVAFGLGVGYDHHPGIFVADTGNYRIVRVEDILDLLHKCAIV